MASDLIHEELPVGFVAQERDFIGTLRRDLSDLTGFLTLAKEVLQNAEDAARAEGKSTWLRFDFKKDGLLISNGTIFSETDWNRLRRLDAGEKAQESDRLGFFQIGLVALYQVTDSPQINSGERRVTFHPLNDASKRLYFEKVPSLEKTEIWLPWADDTDSQFRKALGLSAVTSKDVSKWVEELIEASPDLILFLRRIHTVEVAKDNHVIAQFELHREEITPFRLVSIDCKISSSGQAQQTLWLLAHDEFPLPVGCEEYRHRQRTIEIAFPAERRTLKGTVYAGLPTSIETGLNFHINGTFFPESSRKHIIVEGESPKASWNRAALSTAIALYFNSIDTLKGNLDGLQVSEFFPQGSSIPLPFLSDLQSTFIKFFRNRPIVFTAQQKWATTAEARFLSSADVLACQGADLLGLNRVHPDLRKYRNLFLEMGARDLSADDVAQSVQRMGIEEGKMPTSYPELGSSQGIQAIYCLLGEMLDKTTASQKGKTCQTICELPLCLDADGRVRCFKKVFWLEPRDLQVLEFALPGEKIANLQMRQQFAELYKSLCTPLSAQAVLDLLGRICSADFEKMWADNRINLALLYDYLADLEDEILNSVELKGALTELPIFLARGTFKPLKDLLLPGPYKDWLELDLLLSGEYLTDKVRAFLKNLEVKELDFPTYTRHAIQAISMGNVTHNEHEIKLKLLYEIHHNFPKLEQDDKLLALVGSAPLVRCDDEKYRGATELYFDFEDGQARQLLAEGYHCPHPDYFSVKNHQWAPKLLERLGVAKEPRVSDILSSIRFCTSRKERWRIATEVLGQIFVYLGEHFASMSKEEKDKLGVLKSLRWIPAEGSPDQFFLPREVYHRSRQHLFASQARFHPWAKAVAVRAEWLNILGMPVEPDVNLVARHLMFLANESERPHDDIYLKLDQDADSLSNHVVDNLRNSPCLYVSDKEGFHAPQEIFTHKNLYGKWACLAPRYARFPRLMEKLNVHAEGGVEDDLRTLHKIAEYFDQHKSPLEPETQQVILGIYRRLSANTDEVDTSLDLSGKLVVLNRSMMLVRPEWMFFEDKPGLSARFDHLLEQNLIDWDENTAPFLSGIGVRLLSQAVDAVLVEPPAESIWGELNLIWKERADLLHRVVLTFKRQFPQFSEGWSEEVAKNVTFAIGTPLRVKFELDFKGKKLSSPPNEMEAFYDRVRNIVLISGRIEDESTLTAITHELAMCLNPLIDPCLLIPPLILLVDPDCSKNKASTTLDLLGYDRLGVAVEVQTDEEIPAPIEGAELEVTPAIEEIQPKPKRKVRPWALVSRPLPEEHSGDQMEEDEKERRRTTHDTAIARAEHYEKERGWQPQNVEPEDKGYDLLSLPPSGNEPIYIEVKGLSNAWDQSEAVLTSNEFAVARQLGERYYLYVIDFAGQPNERLFTIKNPANRPTHFAYDAGWQGTSAPPEE